MLKALGLMTVFLFVGIANARWLGTNSGGGGLVVVCPGQGTFQSVELLDLWEAKKGLNPTLDLRPKYESVPLITQVLQGIDGLKRSLVLSPQESYGRDSSEHLANLLRNVSEAFIYQNNLRPGYFSPVIKGLRDVELSLTNDAFEIAVPRAPCEIQQAVIFDDAGEIAYVNLDLVDRLSITDWAGLILHEAFYKVLRTFSFERSSLRVRRAIGFVMSGGNLSPVESHIALERIECLSADQNTRVFIHQIDRESGHFGLTAERLGGVRMIGYSTPNQFMSASSLRALYDEWISPRGEKPFSLRERPWHSPVDYDLNLQFEIRSSSAGMRKAFVNFEDQRHEVNCRLLTESSRPALK